MEFLFLLKSLAEIYNCCGFPHQADDIARLCENNRSLQTDIQMYMNELEMYKQGQGILLRSRVEQAKCKASLTSSFC